MSSVKEVGEPTMKLKPDAVFAVNVLPLCVIPAIASISAVAGDRGMRAGPWGRFGDVPEPGVGRRRHDREVQSESLAVEALLRHGSIHYHADA